MVYRNNKFIKPTMHICLCLLLLAVSCIHDNYKQENVGLIDYIAPKYVQGNIIALIDRRISPVVLERNKLIIFKNRTLDEITTEFKLAGKYISYNVTDITNSYYSDIITIISTDGVNNYISAFGSKLKTAIDIYEPPRINKTNFVKVFECKMDVGRIVSVSTNSSDNNPIWITQTIDYSKVVHINMQGKIILEYKYNDIAIIKPYFIRHTNKYAFFGFNGKDLLFLKIVNNRLTVESKVRTGLNTNTESFKFNEIPSLLNFSHKYSIDCICVTDGKNVVYFDSYTRKFIVKAQFDKIRIGPSYLYLLTDDGTFYLHYTINKNEIIYPKISKLTNYQLLWYSDLPDIFASEMFFVKTDSSKTDFMLVETSNVGVFKTRHIVTKPIKDIKYIIPFTLLRDGSADYTYIYTLDKIYSLEEVVR